MKNNQSLGNGFDNGRRFFLSNMLVGGAVAALPSTAAAGGYPCPTTTRIFEGPITSALPELRAIVADPDVARFLIDITDAMGELGALPLPASGPAQTIIVPSSEKAPIAANIDALVDELVAEFAPSGISEKTRRKIKKTSKKRVFIFLNATHNELTDVRAIWLPLNLSSLPQVQALDQTFIAFDSAGPNLMLLSPMAATSEDEKMLLKLAILASVVAAIVAALLAALQIRVPPVQSDKLVPIIAKAIQNPQGRTAFLTMIEILKKEGQTLGGKMSAILAFLKTLWNLGALKDILKEMLSGFSIFDLVLTIAGIAGVVLSAGASVAVKLGVVGVGLLATLIKAGTEYQKLQGS